ncbi:MAG: hypothetical protein ACTSYA_12445 [Candidatus Kariarchaeaceae archaeon]
MAKKEDHKIVYTKRILEIPEQLQISLQEHHVQDMSVVVGKQLKQKAQQLRVLLLGLIFWHL